MWRHLLVGLGIVGAVAAVPPAAFAQDSSFAVNFGYFALRGEDSRPEGDVLNANRCIDVTFDCEPLLFDIGDFNGATISGEYLLGIGDYFEVSAGIGFYQKTVPSVYEFLTDVDDSEIEQDLKLRVVPMTATIRFIPTGRASGVQPYIGVGLAVLPWKYSETGEFVDTGDYSIFRATYVADGTEVGPLVLGGIKFPIAGHKVLFGGEVRYQQAEADLPDEFLGVNGTEKIDLGGFTYSAVLQLRF